jgi:hypothetical protein
MGVYLTALDDGEIGIGNKLILWTNITFFPRKN